jgi:hypothetical protein
MSDWVDNEKLYRLILAFNIRNNKNIYINVPKNVSNKSLKNTFDLKYVSSDDSGAVYEVFIENPKVEYIDYSKPELEGFDSIL